MTAPPAPPTARAPATGRRASRMAAPVGVGVVAIAVCVVLAVVDPEDRAGWSPRCPFRLATGLDCPGCGGTRAVSALVRGDVALALDHNLVTVLLLPVFVAGWSGWLAHRAGRRRTRIELPNWSGWTLAAVFVAFTVARNLPWGPFGWLASGAG